MFPTLAKPPIREAVIDVRASFETPPSEQAYKDFQARLATHYPNSSPIERMEFHFNVAENRSSQVKELHGIRMESADKCEVVQAQQSGITYSRLTPYKSWGHFVQVARQNAEAYWEVFNPAQAARISTRFINDIRLPGGQVDFDDYLRFGPQLPEGLPQHVSEFRNRIVSPQEDGQTVIVLATTYLGPGIESETKVVLDIDVVRHRSYESLEQAFDSLDDLRALKNTAFFNSITEKTRELFDG